MFKVKRAYETPSSGDGVRILVDRVWPRGVSREQLKLDGWEKELAPSTELRKWFAHDPAKWGAFKKKYAAELKGKKQQLAALRSLGKKRVVTLIYGAKDEAHNQAVALKELL